MVFFIEAICGVLNLRNTGSQSLKNEPEIAFDVQPDSILMPKQLAFLLFRHCDPYAKNGL